MARNDFSWELDIDKIMAGRFDPSVYDFAGAVERGRKVSDKLLAERIGDRIVQKLDISGLGDSHIPQFLKVDTYNDGFKISLKGEGKKYEYVEFGTGIVGANSPTHKFLKSPHSFNWKYDVNKHGDSGWWYPTVPVDPNPTIRPDGDGGWVAWTKGQRPIGFMYAGWLYGTNAAVSTADSYIAKELRKLEAKAK